ncbi:MAG: hypothetical protein R3C32_06405 [Chloroflexota bacterium]
MVLRARLGRLQAGPARRRGAIDPGATIVCVLTGHGLKDPDTAQRMVEPPLAAGPSAADVRRALGW